MNVLLISEVVYSPERSYYSHIYSNSDDLPECFTLEYEHHYWITLINENAPNKGDKCLCGKREYNPNG